MKNRTFGKALGERLSGWRLAGAACALAASSALFAAAAPPAAVPPAAPAVPWAPSDNAAQLWRSATNGDGDTALRLLEQEAVARGEGSLLAEAFAAQQEHRDAVEAQRIERLQDVRSEMASHLADGTLTEALRDAVELYTLAIDKAAVLADPGVLKLVHRAAADAAQAESQGRWLDAHALYYRLNLLYETDTRYKADIERLGRRLVMVRLYAPAVFHSLRSAQRVAEGEEPLAPYTNRGDTWEQTLEGVGRQIVVRAVSQAARQHVDSVRMDVMLLGGLKALDTLVTTADLAEAFPKVGDAAAVARAQEVFAERAAMIRDRGDRTGYRQLSETLDAVIASLDEILGIPAEVVVYEFGNGTMAPLDPYSSILWPDEMRQFERSVRGKFTGIGVHIQLDDAQQLKVVAPIEGTPAHRGGLRRDDLIVGVDGAATLGLTLPQCVDRITGPRGTGVTLTIERPSLEDPFDVVLVRDVIPVYSVKGWRKYAAGQGGWAWYIDEELGIGYVRLTQFTEETTKEFRAAIRAMRKQGALRGLVLDLRYNPGGLLTEAVNIVSLFVDKGIVVTTHNGEDQVRDTHRVRRGMMELAGLPTAVLINSGSASASEIVSGCLQVYDRAVIVGERSFGKGSVQNVFGMPSHAAAAKLTIHYYKLPDGTLLHRKDGASAWGVEPDVAVPMTPEQISATLQLRQDADIVPTGGDGDGDGADTEPADPQQLLDEGLDTQLETALLLLRSQIDPNPSPRAAPASRR